MGTTHICKKRKKDLCIRVFIDYSTDKVLSAAHCKPKFGQIHISDQKRVVPFWVGSLILICQSLLTAKPIKCFVDSPSISKMAQMLHFILMFA